MKKKHKFPFKTKIERLQLQQQLEKWRRGLKRPKVQPPPEKKPIGFVGGGHGHLIRANLFFSQVVLEGFVPKDYSKDSPFSSADAFGARLKKRGYVHLGSGCFSSVYGKPGSDKVLKVTRRPDNWIDYIMWASENGWAGKYAPKVYSYKQYPTGDKDRPFFSVAVVERMEKGYCSVSAEEDSYIASALMWPAMRGNTLAQVYLEDFQPGLPKFLLDFNEKFGKDHTDIGGNNMMVRKDGTFCLTDPLCGRTSFSRNRLRTKDFGPSPAIRKFYERFELVRESQETFH